MRFQTNTIHTGVDKDSAFNSVITPIYQTSTFRFEDVGQTKGFDYTRSGNPTRRALEENISALEGGASAAAVATGMAAVALTLHFFKSGDHIICTHDCYGGTERLLRTYREQFGLEISYVNMNSLSAVQASIKPNTKAFWIETPSNPLLNIVDIKALSQIAHQHGAISIVDNTFLSPFNQRPFELGADIIVHSTTKYLNGHSDVVGGAVVVKSREQAERLQFLANALGQGASPFDSWLVLRGIKTLAPRMKEHERNARAVAEFLSKHSNVRKVFYPGLKTHPQHELAGRQQYGFGAIISFEVDGTREEVNRVLRSTKIFALAESLGGVESLIEHPATMSHASMNPELRESAGINERVIRLSIGIEDVNDLIEDLDHALTFEEKVFVQPGKHKIAVRC
ncbi:MAG TPA: PLP-dependent aspartate aminotransferase family protein [Candidatus Acidoferrales bacterium]|nr:PLP-dependent aspartate aminotransferase family protein [Candidatus Acidoferrales bacterium]